MNFKHFPTGAKLLFISALVIVFAITMCRSSLAQLKEGEKLLAFSLKALDGAVVTVKTEEGKLVVITESVKDGKKTVRKIKPDVLLIDFWATWCPPCRKEIPHLQKLHEKYRSKKDDASQDYDGDITAKEGDGGLVLMGIALERGSAKTLKLFAKKQKLTYVLLAESTAKLDTKELISTVRGAANKYKIEYIPTKYIIDSKGIIKSIYVGLLRPDALEKEILELIPKKEAK